MENQLLQMTQSNDITESFFELAILKQRIIYPVTWKSLFQKLNIRFFVYFSKGVFMGLGMYMIEYLVLSKRLAF